MNEDMYSMNAGDGTDPEPKGRKRKLESSNNGATLEDITAEQPVSAFQNNNNINATTPPLADITQVQQSNSTPNDNTFEASIAKLPRALQHAIAHQCMPSCFGAIVW